MGVTAGVLLLAIEDRGGPIQTTGPESPSATSTSAPDHDELSPAQVIDHPEATLRDLVTVPGDNRARAAVWQLCEDDHCRRSRQAVAVTGDGFRTRSALLAGAQAFIRELSRDAFHLAWDRGSREVLRTDGSAVPVRFDGTVAPLGDGEALLGSPYVLGRFDAVDPLTGRAHAIPVPADVQELVAQPDGAFSAWAEVWSRAPFAQCGRPMAERARESTCSTRTSAR